MSYDASIICLANYCRSPVAQYLLKKRFPECNFNSAGLKPLLSPHMDRRSEKFLKSRGINNFSHMPKKVDLKLMNESEIIFAMDPIILMNLNKLYSSHVKKIKLINYLSPSKTIFDPYKFSDNEYNEVMKNIESVIEDLILY